MTAELAPIDSWRAVVLYGRNSATYKIALATCLVDAARDGQDYISLQDLATRFFGAYRERLQSGKRQGTSGTTELERIVQAHESGKLTHAQAVERTAQQGFNDVIPRFHTVGGGDVPHRFYVEDRQGMTLRGLTLTDNLFPIFSASLPPVVAQEALSRWDLLETAFEMRLPVEVLGTDEHMLYRLRGYERTNITPVRPVFHGYQNGLCFYCGDPLVEASIHVDHLIPRVFLHHDEIWNLVLADSACNLSKSARLPALQHLERLWGRNEYFIASNHPIKRHLIAQTGPSPARRRHFYQSAYNDARRTVVQVWQGKSSYPLNPLASLGIAQSV